MVTSEKYTKIINLICSIKGISLEEQHKILEDKECKYLLLLLMKKYDCLDIKRLEDDFNLPNMKRVFSNIKKAEEHFLINYYFRNQYFSLDELISK